MWGYGTTRPTQPIWITVNVFGFFHLSVDMDVNDGAPEADLIINHVDQNHYGSDRNSDSEVDRPSSPTDLQENHTAADPQAMRHRDEDENGQTHPSELPLGSEGGAEMVLMDDQVQHYITPSALKKHIHTETTKVNNELRSLITKEIRKPGRRMYPNLVYRQGRQNNRNREQLPLTLKSFFFSYVTMVASKSHKCD